MTKLICTGSDVAAVNDAAPEVMFPNYIRVGMLQERLEYHLGVGRPLWLKKKPAGE